MASAPENYTPAGSVSSAELKQYVERLERLEEEKKGIAEDIKGVMAELKMQGFDGKTVRKVLRLRQMKQNERMEEEALLQTYLEALGMA
ncbi:MAG: GapR family DNA-binding domain-containing protein [Sphingomonadaceae bacterium]